jgi:TonB family protein
MAAAYSTFGNFLLLRRRSQDGLGTLWRAGEMERTGFKRIVWLRRFDQGGLDRASLIADVASANQIAQTLRATNVVRNALHGSEGGIPFVAWDYVPAQPLDQLLARVVEEEFPIAIDNALLIVEKLTAGLAAASAVDVQGEPLIHGFLVPQLVVVGNDGEAQVAGFGMSRGLRANLDRIAVRKLTASYLAPEVLAEGPSTRRSDVYSLGAILYQLLTGTALPAEVAARASALERPQLGFDEGPVPQDVATILHKALAQRPDDRYPSAAELKREMERLLYGGAYSPTTFNLALFMDRLYRSEIEEEDRELDRERALDVGPYYQTPKAEVPQPPPPVAVAQRPSRAWLYAAVGGAVVLLSVIGYLLISRPSSPPAVDQEAQKRMLQELVNTQVAQALKEKEDQLRKELEAEKARTEELRQQLDKQQRGAAGGARQVATEEGQRLQRELAAREAEQTRKEEELAKVRQQQQAELVKASGPGLAPASVPPVQPTTLAAAPAQVSMAPTLPVVTPTAAPVPAMAVPAVPTPVSNVPLANGFGTSVREGDLVDLTEVDVTPQTLVETKVTLPSALARTPLSGYVILNVLVNEKGGVDDVTVLREFSPPTPGVDKACIDAVKKNRYKPAMKDGKPVKTWMTVKMTFTPATR